MLSFFTWPLDILEEIRATRALITAFMRRTTGEFVHLHTRLKEMETAMSVATDALNSAVSDLAKASEAMVAKINDEAVKIDELLKNDDTPDVDAATARIREMAASLNDKLGALTQSVAAVGETTTGAAAAPGVGAGVDGGAGPALAGVPATPGGVGAEGAGPAVPSSDFIVTETSVNQDTSGPAAETAAQVGPAAPEAETAPDNASTKRSSK